MDEAQINAIRERVSTLSKEILCFLAEKGASDGTAVAALTNSAAIITKHGGRKAMVNFANLLRQTAQMMEDEALQKDHVH